MTKLAHRFALIILPSLTMLVMGVIPSLLDGNRALTLILFGASTVLLTGVAWFASKRLQEEFSRPILDLVETAREISSTQDFSIRAVTDSDGEVGLLNDAVNDMLVQMEKRHRDLVEEGDRLTAEVTARTQEVLESKEAHSRELRESNELRASNKQLAAATGQAIAASHAKSQFMANLTHEIRTPINGALGMTELLLNTDLTPQQTKFARTVLESGEDLLSIVNDILDFSKVEAGKLERVDHRLFSPKDCVTKVSELLKGRAELKGLTLSTECADDLPHTMLGDGQRLRQVLTNFVGNAIKFTEQGQIVIRTTVAKESDDFRTIRFEVVDTGVGIADHLHEYVFEGFSQADNSTAHQFGGAHPHGTSTGDIHRAALRVRPLGWVSLNQSRDIHRGHPPCRPARPTTEVGVPQSIMPGVPRAAGVRGTSTGDIHRAALRVRPLRWASLNQSPAARIRRDLTGDGHAGRPPSGGRPRWVPDIAPQPTGPMLADTHQGLVAHPPRDIHRGHPPCRPARPTTEVGVPQSITRDVSARSDVRLFLMPGVLHCAGGPGPWTSTVPPCASDH